MQLHKDIVTIIDKYVHTHNMNTLNREYLERTKIDEYAYTVYGVFTCKIYVSLSDTTLNASKAFNYRSHVLKERNIKSYHYILSMNKTIADQSGVYSDDNNGGPFLLVQPLPSNY